MALLYTTSNLHFLVWKTEIQVRHLLCQRNMDPQLWLFLGSEINLKYFFFTQITNNVSYFYIILPLHDNKFLLFHISDPYCCLSVNLTSLLTLSQMIHHSVDVLPSCLSNQSIIKLQRLATERKSTVVNIYWCLVWLYHFIAMWFYKVVIKRITQLQIGIQAASLLILQNLDLNFILTNATHF